MSIDDELREPQTVTEGDRALQLFTDRYELTRLFAGYLNEEPPRKTILFFHGDGGNGKSLLLKFLRQRCCKRFSPKTWQQLQAIPKDEVAKVAAYIENAKPGEDCIPVPAVLLDFSQNLIGDRLKSPFDGLLMLRRNLAEAFADLPYRLRFPLYDFACVWYFYKTGNLEQAKELLPSEEMDFITGIVDAVSETSYASIAKAVLGVFGKHLGEKFKLSLQKRGLKEEDIKAIQGMEPQTELIDELPRLFAKDLNAAMAQQEELKRIVLFFDAHEAFWGHQRDLPEEVFFQRDEWLRCLLRALDVDAGIVAVVSGREKPRWAEANQSTRIPQQYLDSHLVGHFSAPDARDYLQKADIKDAALKQSLIDYASVAAEEVHPLYLGLCADVVLAARAQGKFLTPDDFPTAPQTPDKSRELINRLLRYVDKEVEVAVHALSACRAFDFELYLKLGQALHFHATRAAFFDILTRFSFVWQAQRRVENWYRIHDLLRRLDDESGNETTRRAHEVLEQHYRERGEVAEAIYHANRLDWERGVKEWVQVFDQTLQRSCYQLCHRLLEVRSELIIQSDFKLGIVSRAEGDYFAQLARYAEAKQEYLEALSAYDQDLKLTPNDPTTLNNKGIALKSLGDLQTVLADYPQALQFYLEAIATYNSALTLASDENKILNNKGNAQSSLGELQTRVAKYPQALQAYSKAIATYNSALTHAPDDIQILTNMGVVLQNLGDLQALRAQPLAALQSYCKAIATHNHALSLAPHDIQILNNQGNTLHSLGDLQVRLPQNLDALQSYKEAITVYDKALTLAPDDVKILSNKGNTLAKLGDLQTQLGWNPKALQSYQDALAAYAQALTQAPDSVQILNNKANALRSLADLQTRLAPSSEVLPIYKEAITVYNLAITLTPNDVGILKNKGNALQQLGQLQIKLDTYMDALKSFQEAIATYNQVLTLAPDHVYTLNNKGRAFMGLSLVQMELSQPQEVFKSWKAALAAYTRYLEIAPDDEQVRNLRDELKERLDILGNGRW
jgi:tetratricopeptide (TPR) repeat protein